MHPEDTMKSMWSGNDITSELFKVALAIGLSFIVIKFLKKGFEVYILWTDGDVDREPLLLLTGFIKALVIASCFPIMYKYLAKLIEEITLLMLASLSNAEEVVDGVITLSVTGITGKALASNANIIGVGGIIALVIFIIYSIMCLLLYIQFIVKGLELLILRIGLPIACIGLMDSNDGVYKTYMEKIIKVTVGVVVQIILFRLGLVFMISFNPFWAIASMMLALKTPEFLNEFIVTSRSGGGGLSKVYYTSRMAGNVGSAIKRFKGGA